MLGQAGTVGTRAAVSQRLSRRAFVFQTFAAGVSVLAARGRTQLRTPFVSLNGSLTGKIEWTEFVRGTEDRSYGYTQDDDDYYAPPASTPESEPAPASPDETTPAEPEPAEPEQTSPVVPPAPPASRRPSLPPPTPPPTVAPE